MKTKCFCLILVCLITTNTVAEEPKDRFAVTPENCGDMTLEKCREAMAWAKAYHEKVTADTAAKKAKIQQMHEEALDTLSSETQ